MRSLIFGLILLTCAPAASAGELQLSMRDGRVTLDARDVTVRQILMEWARIGKTRLVNAERMTGGLVTLKLENVPERQALETILRTIPGYMAVPRQSFVADASIYDSILLMPTTTAVAAARPPTAGLRGQPGGANFTQLRPAPPSFAPGMLPEQTEPPDDQADDPAIAAAAAAGLVPVNAPMPGPGPISAPLLSPGGSQPTSTQNPPPGTVAPAPNPWNAPPGSTSAPTFTPPPPPPSTNAPITRPRPPVPDR